MNKLIPLICTGWLIVAAVVFYHRSHGQQFFKPLLKTHTIQPTPSIGLGAPISRVHVRWAPIDSIEWIVLIDSEHLVMSRDISTLATKGPPDYDWIDGRWYKNYPTGKINVEYVEHLGYRCITSLEWYFLKRKGSQTIIVNPYP